MYLEHPCFRDSATPVESYFFSGGDETQSGFEIEGARLYYARAVIHGDRVRVEPGPKVSTDDSWPVAACRRMASARAFSM